MRVDSSTPDTPAVPTRLETKVTISPWVNERYPPVNDLLCSRDVARLMRRSRWVLTGLSLIGRFPKRLKFRGRAIGWCRSEILDWMSRGLAVEPAEQERKSAPSICARRHPRQGRLPLECAPGCVAPRDYSTHRPAAPCNSCRRDRASEKFKHDR